MSGVGAAVASALSDGAVPSGTQLKAARVAAGVSLVMVARRGRLSVSHLSRVESGQRPVSPSVLCAYRTAGVQVDGTAAGTDAAVAGVRRSSGPELGSCRGRGAGSVAAGLPGPAEPVGVQVPVGGGRMVGGYPPGAVARVPRSTFESLVRVTAATRVQTSDDGSWLPCLCVEDAGGVVMFTVDELVTLADGGAAVARAAALAFGERMAAAVAVWLQQLRAVPDAVPTVDGGCS